MLALPQKRFYLKQVYLLDNPPHNLSVVIVLLLSFQSQWQHLVLSPLSPLMNYFKWFLSKENSRDKQTQMVIQKIQHSCCQTNQLFLSHNLVCICTLHEDMQIPSIRGNVGRQICLAFYYLFFYFPLNSNLKVLVCYSSSIHFIVVLSCGWFGP